MKKIRFRKNLIHDYAINRVWWLNPVRIYTILMLLVFGAYWMSGTQYKILYHTNKAINEGYILLYFLSFLLFSLGYSISKKYRFFLKLNLKNENKIDILDVYRVYKVFFGICIGAYLIWYFNFIFINGWEILLNFKSFSSISRVIYYLHNHSGKITGITTFTELGIIVIPLAVYLLYESDNWIERHKRKRDILFIFLLAFFRALAFSERLAIVELLIAYLVAYLAKNRRLKKNIWVALFPFLALILLFIIFGIFEYSRSWLTYYVHYYDSYSSFIVQRVIGYYTNAINTECLYIQHGPDIIFPFRSVQWIWELPGFSNLMNAMLSMNLFDKYHMVLRQFGNPEYNNCGGILTFYTDYRNFFFVFEIIFGYMVGRIYKSYLKGNLFGLLGYVLVFLTLIDMPRFFTLGLPKTFFVYLGLIFMYVYLKRPKNREKSGLR